MKLNIKINKKILSIGILGVLCAIILYIFFVGIKVPFNKTYNGYISSDDSKVNEQIELSIKGVTTYKFFKDYKKEVSVDVKNDNLPSISNLILDRDTNEPNYFLFTSGIRTVDEIKVIENVQISKDLKNIIVDLSNTADNRNYHITAPADSRIEADKIRIQ